MRSNENEIIKAAAAHLPVAEIEQLEDRQYRSGNHDIGINVNDSSSNAFQESLPVLKKLGVTSVRLWYGVGDWSDRKIEGGLQRAIDYHNLGYDVTLTIAIDDKQVPTTSEVHSWFKWAAGNDALRGAVDRWEIGNEVDSTNYWKGTLKQYVSNFLSPASEELHAEGEKVISAGVSWNPQDVQTMIDYGMLDMVDYVGFHPYANGVGLQKQRIAELQAVVGGRKPLVATEWNVRGYENNKAAWATAVSDAFGQVRAGFSLDYYYCLFTADTKAGPSGLMSNKGVINTPFYNVFLKASQGIATGTGGDTSGGGNDGSTPVVGGTTGGSTGTSTGNTPSSVDMKIALYNADTDRVISGYSNLSAGQVIDLAKLPTRNLAIVVLPTSGAKSIKMKLNGVTDIQNTAPYAFFGDTNGNLIGHKMAVGSYSLAVTPYTKKDATGTAYAGKSVNFKIEDTSKTTVPVKPPVTTPPTDSDTKAEMIDFSLINAKTGKVVKGYEHITSSTTISLASMTTLSLALRANADDDTKSVLLSVNGKSHVENALPYAVFGDDYGKYASWKPVAGKYTLSGTAFDAKGAKGHRGTSLSITLKFV